MSFKAKDLSYDAKEPAFLQKLRNQYGNNTGRLERPSIRPRKPKEHVEEDEPTYVDEETNEVISREDYEALVNGGDQPESDKKKPGEDDGQSAPQMDADGKSTAEKEAPVSKQAIADIGGQKKRKQAKVVGEDNRAEETEEPARKDPGSKKPKQKKKKIKLSFDEEA